MIEHDEPGFVLTCHDVTERRALEQQLSYQAFHDSLTGLANRALFRDRLEHAIARTSRSETRFAVLFIDLDDFKDVNDSLGHAAGDSMLRQMTHRLGEAVREEDTVARLGGDEFAILLESIDSDDEVITVANRIVVSAREPFEVGESVISSGLSIGIAIADATAISAEAVMRNADLALYEAKNLGKNRHALFAPAMHEQAVDRLQLSADLRDAIDQGQLICHYQPIVELATDAIVGVEALVRWQHPDGDCSAPASSSGSPRRAVSSCPLGHEVLRMALAAHRAVAARHPRLRRADPDGEPQRSPGAGGHAGRRGPRGSCRVGRPPVHAGPGDHRVDAPSRARASRWSGCASLPTSASASSSTTSAPGYSSLSYLQQLPVHGIKLAREFVCTLGAGQCRRAGRRQPRQHDPEHRRDAGSHLDHRRGCRDGRAAPGSGRPRLHARAGLPDGPADAGDALASLLQDRLPRRLADVST